MGAAALIFAPGTSKLTLTPSSASGNDAVVAMSYPWAMLFRSPVSIKFEPLMATIDPGAMEVWKLALLSTCPGVMVATGRMNAFVDSGVNEPTLAVMEGEVPAAGPRKTSA